MMASARAGPICGRASSCSLLAALRSISPPWGGAAGVAPGAAGLVAGVVGAGLGVDGLAGGLGAGVWARAGAVIRASMVVRAAKSRGRMLLSADVRWACRLCARRAGLPGIPLPLGPKHRPQEREALRVAVERRCGQDGHGRT